MTTQELRSYIDKTLGNSLRCLLPSFWWKKLFNSVVDVIEDSTKNNQNNTSGSKDIVFYLTEGANGDEVTNNISSFKQLQNFDLKNPDRDIVLLVDPTNDYFEYFGGYLLKAREFIANAKGYSITGNLIGKDCCIHLQSDGAVEIEVIDEDSTKYPYYEGNIDSALQVDKWYKYICEHYAKSFTDQLHPYIIQALASNIELQGTLKTLFSPNVYASKEPTKIEAGLVSDTSFPMMFFGNSMVVDGTLMHANSRNIEIKGSNIFDGELTYGKYTTYGEVDSYNYYLLRSRLRSTSKMEVNPGEKYTFVSKTCNFWVNIYEYDSNNTFLKKQTIHVIDPDGNVFVSDIFSTSENTAYIAFDLWLYSNTMKVYDIAIYKSSDYISAITVKKQKLYDSYTTTLAGIGDIKDIAYGQFVVRRIGTRKYEEGDYDNENVLTDGKNTAYILDTPVYEKTMGLIFNVLIGPLSGSTISGDSEVPLGIKFTNNIHTAESSFFEGAIQSVLIGAQGDFYKNLANKTYVDSAINSSIKEVLNTEI